MGSSIICPLRLSWFSQRDYAFTFLGSLSRISSVTRLGTICQERPKGSLIQPDLRCSP